MKRLIVMRHAKSAWDVPGLRDHDRPLNLRGRLAAGLMGAWISEVLGQVDAARISTSARTCETFARLATQLSQTPKLERLSELYLADTDTLLGSVKAAPKDAETLLILGHNPDIEDFAQKLCAPESARTGRFVTAATAIYNVPSSWSEVDFGSLYLVAFEQPKSLV